MSLERECDWRLENLCRDSHIWLLQVATNITRHTENAEDAVSELYVYLQTTKNPKIFWGNSYNLIYCMRAIKSRWLNRVIRGCKTQSYSDMSKWDTTDTPYDIDRDMELAGTYDDVLAELRRLKGTKQFAQAQIFEMYALTDDTMMDVANKIGISKSTTFSCIKKIKGHLKFNIQNPFGNE